MLIFQKKKKKFIKISICTVKTNPNDCPPRKSKLLYVFLAATCWAINTHTALEKTELWCYVRKLELSQTVKEGKRY